MVFLRLMSYRHNSYGAMENENSHFLELKTNDSLRGAYRGVSPRFSL